MGPLSKSPLSVHWNCVSEDKETSVMYSRQEPRYNNVPGDWQNLFTITRFCDIEVFFHMFYYYWAWGKENRLLYRGLCYIEVCYIDVPQLYVMYDSHLLIAMHSKGHQHLPPTSSSSFKETHTGIVFDS